MAQCWLTLTTNIWPMYCCGMLATKSSESGCCNTETNTSVTRPLMNHIPGMARTGNYTFSMTNATQALDMIGLML